jgi:hypothetical protein
MGFFHPALIHDPGQAAEPRPAEVRRVEAKPRSAPVWNDFRLAQSSAGPSFGIGSSAGPVGGSINPYTAVPSGSGAATSVVAPEATGRSTGSETGGGFLGTQQEQGGGAGEGTSGAASPSSNGVTPTRTAVPNSGDAPNHPGPGASDRSALGPGGTRGGRLMDTGNSIKSPPPPSLTNRPPGHSPPANPRRKSSSAAGAPAAAKKPPPADTTPPPPADNTPPPSDTSPPPPAPAESGIGSTR